MISDQKNALLHPPASALLSLVVLSLLFLSPSVLARTLIFQADETPSSVAQGSEDASENKPGAIPSSELNDTLIAPSAQVSSANSELFFMIEELQQQVKTLRGRVEEQANEIRHLKRNAKARYLDLDSRLLGLSKTLDSRSSVGVKTSPQPEGASLQVPEVAASTVKNVAKPLAQSSEAAKAAYQQAYSLIKEKKFEQAVSEFYAFIEKYPDGPLTGNAYYWLGEVYLVLPQLEQARQAFSIVVQAYPEHSKVADSLFKLGVAYDRLQNAKESQRYLSEVQKRFPNSTAAKLANSYKINR